MTTDLETRITRLEDTNAIQALGILYGYVMDERDEDGIRRIFCADATLRSQDGVFAATGMDEIVTTYLGRFAALGPTNHYSHGHVVRFDDDDADVAYGLLASHAEVTRNGVGMVVALRYKDTYRRDGGQWKFQDRLMSYMYYLPDRRVCGRPRRRRRQRARLRGPPPGRLARVAPERRQAQRLAVGLPRLRFTSHVMSHLRS